MCGFKCGDFVNKVVGRYAFPGYVVAVYEIEPDVWRVDVRMAGFNVIHIFDPQMLDLITPEKYKLVSQKIEEALEILADPLAGR